MITNYQRYMLSNGNLSKVVAEIINEEDDFPNTRILDTYSLEFLDLPNEFSGKDFTFIGDEYRIQVGNHDYFIDLLFYSRQLSCLVAFELKLGEFKR